MNDKIIASKVLINGHIITMEEESTSNTSIAILDDTIIAITSDKKINEYISQDTEVIDLKGKTVLPGLIDPHGHFSFVAVSRKAYINASCYPIGDIKNISDLQNKLKDYVKNDNSNDPVIAIEFDDTLIDEYRMPTASDLDIVSTTRPVFVLHVSAHMLSANTYAIEEAGIIDNSFNPEGGRVYYENGKAVGIFEEASAMAPFSKTLFNTLKFTRDLGYLRDASNYYLSKGITTVCEGESNLKTSLLLENAVDNDIIKNRVILCPHIESLSSTPFEINYKDSLKIIDGPIKLFMDGSIQAYTAYLSKPYEKQHPTRPKPIDYLGFPTLTKEQLKKSLENVLEINKQFAIHCNGDAALDDVIEIYQEVFDENKRDKRSLIIHCQTARDDQLDKMKEIGLYPSFFPAHIYVWGDRHYNTFLGHERGSRINPVGSALNKGLIYSLHNDAPVTNPDPLKLVWNASSRVTSSNKILGKDQRISVYDALKGVTIYAAYQYHLEDKLGSLKVGKRADLTILEENPLEVPINHIKDIVISSTWIDGKEIYRI
ncbi:amidohydrolase [Clostridium cylindrosporum]|uniref:N-substituted formamide deformylase NfdA n=1 Tax=Clostridium cylindrosporum DSM 605 TaxID=1121307 RepID=A0A0J8DA15_CLOCY|nr:amidohydrolase [Clostridium cylindrosporum]KMT21159.1 N-substituted formamide deformylase NfdA [Clostridium cylindrosporum DSM 605]